MAVQEVKLCLLGDTHVGKTSIVYRFVYDSFKPVMETTIGAAFLTKTTIIDGKTYKFHLWDTAGQEKYRALAPMYYRGAEAAIIVYDITAESTFKTVKFWMSELRKYASPNIVLAVAGNKSDLEDLRDVPYKEAREYLEQNNVIFLETSAKSATNIAVLFMEIGKKICLNPDIPGDIQEGNVRLTRTGQQRSREKACCSS